MADDDVKYELKTVRTIRGTEARTTAKWQKEGWEPVTQDQGRLQTQITFRRPKPKTPWRLLAASGGAVLVLAVVAVTMGVIQGDGNPEPTSSPTKAVAAPSELPSEAPDDEPTPVEPESSEPGPSEPAEEEPLTVENNEVKILRHS